MVDGIRVSGSTEMVVVFLLPLAVWASLLGGEIFPWRACVLCFSSNSPIFTLRSETGIRLTRLSMRARRSLAWRAYWARSLRARSVTEGLALNQQDNRNILSNCKLSIKACFWLLVIRSFLGGLPVGVVTPYASSSADLRFPVTGGIVM